jgi:hypothetical protein
MCRILVYIFWKFGSVTTKNGVRVQLVANESFPLIYPNIEVLADVLCLQIKNVPFRINVEKIQ